MSAHLIEVAARPAERVLVVEQCWFCGQKWTVTPTPEHDRVVVNEGVCPNGCEVEEVFFQRKRRKSVAAPVVPQEETCRACKGTRYVRMCVAGDWIDDYPCRDCASEER